MITLETTYNTDAINSVEPAFLALLDLTQNKLVKPFTPAFLHTFKAKLQIDRQLNA